MRMNIKKGIEVGDAVTLDWVSFTVPWAEGFGLRWAEESFGPFGRPGGGQRGYNRWMSVYETGCVAWHETRPEQGVFVRLPASALGLMSCLDGAAMRDPLGLLRFIARSGGHFTRVDFAIDDRAGLLDVDVIAQAVTEGCYTSRWRSVVETRDLAGGSGHSLRFGSRMSDCLVRIYDKEAERAAAGEPDTGHWVRVEAEFHGESACLMVAAILKSGLQPLRDWLGSELVFRDGGGSDSNKTRWPVSTWWASFVRGIGAAVRLTLPKVASSIERKRAWLETQVARVLALVTLADKRGGAWFDDLFALGCRRLTPLDEVLIASALA